MNDISNFLKYQQALDENWEGWSFIERAEQKFWSEPNTQISEAFNREEITEWCKARCKGDWVVAGGSVMLKDPRDVMLFKLMFFDSYAKVK